MDRWDRKAGMNCYFQGCTEKGTTKEHIPPRSFFPEDERLQLPTVKSCKAHNNDKSTNDLYVLAQICMNASPSNRAYEVFQQRVAPQLSHNNDALRRMLLQGAVNVPGGVKYPVDHARFDEFFTALSCGLIYKSQKAPLPSDSLIDHMGDPTLKYPRDALRDWWQEYMGHPPPEGGFGHLGNLIDTLFFASLAREEGHPALARIVYHDDGVQGLERTREHADFDSSQGPALAWTVIPFHPIRLTVNALVKLTPAAHVERTAIIVGPHDGQLHILGLARRSKSTDGGDVWVFSAPEPGFIVVHRAGGEIFRYERGQRLSPEQKFSLWKILHTDGLVKQ